MDHKKMPNERDPIVDIESGGSEFEEDRNDKPMTGNKRAKSLQRSVSGTLTFERSDQSDSSNDSPSDIESSIYNKIGGGNGELLPLVDKRTVKEKHKTSVKKAPKPPRPRKGPALDKTDLQLVKEISELAMRKRALKALKKIRAVKSPSPPSSNSSLWAVVITVLFFIAIIFEGFGSGQSSPLTFHDSPEPTGGVASGFISVKFGDHILESDDVPNFVGKKTGSQSWTSAK